MSVPRKPNTILLALSAWLALCASSLHACSIPVFQYALEYWDAAPYEVIIFHKGPLSKEDVSTTDLLRTRASDAQTRANMNVQMVNLAKDTSTRMRELWESQDSDKLPRVVVCFPGTPGPEKVVWSGPLDEKSVLLIADSPKRGELVRKILGGHGIVWVILESGDKGRDDATAAFLFEKSKELAARLQALSPFDDVLDEQTRTTAGPQNPAPDAATSESDTSWKLSCSVVRLARTDPSEQVFVNMLLRSEPDLEQFSGKPIAFPVFGRGRLLCALVGGGINRETVEEVIVFLAGPCSCLVKDLNPGFDLLMSADWEGGLAGRLTVWETPPALTGVMPEAQFTEGEGMSDGDDSSIAEGRLADSLLRNVLVIVLVIIILVSVGVIILRRQSARTGS